MIPLARRVSTAAVLSTSIFLLIQQRHAQAGTTHVKSSNGTENWTGATWSNGTPNAVGDIAQYGPTATGANANTTLNADVFIGQLQKGGNKYWTIISDGSHAFTLDNTSNNTSNLFLGSLAAITTNGSNSTGAFTVNPNLKIGNSGGVANPGLVIGTVATGTSAVPGNVVIGGGISGLGGLFIANASRGTAVNAGTVTFNGVINNSGTINVGQFEFDSAVQTGTGTTTFNGAIGSSVTGFTNVGAGGIAFNGPVTLTGEMVFNGTGTTAVSSNASGVLNNSGTILNVGTTTGTTVLAGGIGSNVTSVTQGSASSAMTISGGVSVNSGGTTFATLQTAKTLTVSGAVNGPGDLIIAPNSSAGINISGSINNTGAITSAGTAGPASLGAVSSNVTAISQTGTNPFTVGAVTLGASETFTSNNSGSFTLSGITGPGNVILNANSGGNITVQTGTINNTGTVTNSGTGTGVVAISSVVGNNVSSITQASASSQLNLSASNPNFTGGVLIKQGLVLGSTSTAFGTAPIQLGDTALNANDAQLRTNIGTGNVTNAIQLLSGTTGRLVVGINNSSSSSTYSGGITGSNNLYLNNTSNQSMIFAVNPINNSGAVYLMSSGTGTTQINLAVGLGSNVTAFTTNGAGSLLMNGNTTVNGPVTFSGTGTSSVSFASTGVLNNSGTIINNGTTTGSSTISQVIGSAVGLITQNSATSQLNLNNANLFTAGLLVKQGTVATSNNAGFGASANVITLGDTTGDATLLLTGIVMNLANAIVLGANSSGILTIASNSNVSGNAFNSNIELNGRNLNIADNAAVSAAYLNIQNVAGAFTGTGTISNSGTGFGLVRLAGVIGSNVASVTQNSATSPLVLQANHNFAELYVNAGTATGNNSSNINVTTAFGAGTIHLGANSSNAAATLQTAGANADQITNGIVLGNTSGLLSISNTNAATTATFGLLSGGNGVTVNASLGSGGLAFASVNITGTLINATATGTGPITITGGMTGGSVLQNSATSALALPGSNTYTGATTIAQGTLTLGAAGSLGGTAIAVNGGTFLAPGSNTIGAGGSSPLVAVNGGTLSLLGGNISTLSINSGTPGATVLTFAGGAYALEVSGATADEIVLGAGLKADGGASTVNITPTFLASPSSGSRTILLAPGGLQNPSSFVLTANSGNFGGNTVSLSNTATTLELNVVAAPTHSLLYFTGAIDNTFTTFTGGNTNNSNFSTDQAGASDAHAGPDSTTELHFTATSLGSSARTVTLNTAQNVESIAIDGQVANPLTLAAGTAGALTLHPSDSSRGVTNSASAGGTLTISTPVILDGDASFTNTANSTSITPLLTISGNVTGAGDLRLRSNGNTSVNNPSVVTLSGSVNHTGSIINDGTGTISGTSPYHVVAVSGAIGSNVTGVIQNSMNTVLTLSGAAPNTYSGLTTVTLGQLRLGKVAGVNAVGGNILVNGGVVALLANNQIPDTATVTITSGMFNSSSATVINFGSNGVDETIAALDVSGSGIYQNVNLNSANGTGLVVSGVANFTGGFGAAYFSGSGGRAQFGTLNIADMAVTNQSSFTPTLANVANSFVVYGNSTARQSLVNVGAGGLTLTAATTNNYLSLRKGGSANVLGSKLTLEGDVTSNGNGSWANFIMQDAIAGNNGSIAVDLAGTSTGPVSRNFNTNADLTIAVPINNGTASAGSIVKTGSGTLILDRIAGTAQFTPSNFTGTTTINAGTIRASAADVLAKTSAITVNNTGTLLLGNTLNGAISSADRVGDSVPITLNGGGTVGFTAATYSASETMGALTLSSNSSLDFGDGSGNTLTFANLPALSPGVEVNIYHYTSTVYGEDSGLVSQDRLLFQVLPSGGYSDAQLANIRFYDDSGKLYGVGARQISYADAYEFVPVPEPASVFSTGGLAGLAVLREMRRRRRIRAAAVDLS